MNNCGGNVNFLVTPNFVNCNTCNCNPCRCRSCNDNGCPILLDTACVIYHKSQTTATGLINLDLPNGSTLQLILDTIDVKIGQVDVQDLALPILRATYTITDLLTFATAVDTEFGVVETDIAALQAVISTPITKTDTDSITLTLSGTLDHHIQADVNISAISGNMLTSEPDGLYSQAQTVSINYVAKTLSLSNANTVSFASIVAGSIGFLGNLTADPSATDGQYWFRTDTDELKIQLNGSTRVITIV